MDEFNSNKVIIVIVPRKLKYLKEHITIANFRKLEQIKKYLGDKMSPFVSIKVRNPEFEYLRIQCDIKFADRGNEGYDIAKLKKKSPILFVLGLLTNLMLWNLIKRFM